MARSSDEMARKVAQKCPQCETVFVKTGLVYCTLDGSELIEYEFEDHQLIEKIVSETMEECLKRAIEIVDSQETIHETGEDQNLLEETLDEQLNFLQDKVDENTDILFDLDEIRRKSNLQADYSIE